MIHYIYGLTDENGIVHYIGCTKIEPELRLYQHVHFPASRGLREWIKQLSREPGIIALDIVNEGEDAKKLETFHILSHLDAGFPLLNRILFHSYCRDTSQDKKGWRNRSTVE